MALWGHLVGGPEVFKMTTDLVCSAIPPPQRAINDLINRLLRARARLLDWLSMARQRMGLSVEVEPEEWRDAAVFPLAGERCPGYGDGTQLALRGTYTTCRILKARLLVALAPARFRHLEAECQELAARIMSLGEQPTHGYVSGSIVGSLFMSQSSWIAQAIVETKAIWGEGDCGNGGMIEARKFEAWCAAIGRKLPDR